MRPAKLVVGSGTGSTADVMTLASRLADHARRQSLALIRLGRSRDPNSSSCYLDLRDPSSRLWLIRVSNHHRPKRNNHPVPHFDLTALDGTSGFPEACEFLDRIAAGAIEWSPAAPAPKQKPRRHRR